MEQSTKKTIVVYTSKPLLDGNNRSIKLFNIVKQLKLAAALFSTKSNDVVVNKQHDDLQLLLQNVIPFDPLSSLKQILDFIVSCKKTICDLKDNKLDFLSQKDNIKQICHFLKQKKYVCKYREFKNENLVKLFDFLHTDLSVFIKKMQELTTPTEQIASNIKNIVNCRMVDSEVIVAFNLYNTFRDFDDVYCGFNTKSFSTIRKLFQLEKVHNTLIQKQEKKKIKTTVKTIKERNKQINELIEMSHQNKQVLKKPNFYLFSIYNKSLFYSKLTQSFVKKWVTKYYLSYVKTG